MSDEQHGTHKSWSIDSWPALQSAATLLMMAVAGLVWGLKLEGRIDMIGSGHRADMDKMEGKVGALETVTQKGILPVTEVRLHAIDAQISDIRADLDTCINRKR